MIPKILWILNQFENSKNGDLNETTIYIQFQLNGLIKTNQNLYNNNKDQKTQLKVQGLNKNITIKSYTYVTREPSEPNESNRPKPNQKLSITVVVHSDLCYGEHG